MISDTIELTFEYLLGFKLGLKFSFNPVGVMNAPCVEGVETKSQHNNSKSSCTSTVPSPNACTEPIPRDEIPTVILLANNSLNMLPDGVGNTSISPIKSSPSHHNFLML